jgi:hypothetical protein
MTPEQEERARAFARAAEVLGTAGTMTLTGAPETGRAVLSFETEAGAYAVELTPAHIIAIAAAAPAVLAGICD